MNQDGPGAILFLDIEASGLDERGYPIEIGWVMADGSGGAVLIRPAWRWTYWSSTAERLHGISRAELATSGLPPAEAAGLVAAAVRDRIVYLDDPEWDRHWLSLLFAEAGLTPGYAARDTGEAMDLALAPLAAAAPPSGDGHAGPWRETARGRQILALARDHADRQAPRTHRAGADARHAWTMWRRVTDLVAAAGRADTGL